MTPQRKTASELAAAASARAAHLSEARSASEQLGKLLLELQKLDRLDDEARAQVGRLRDDLAARIDTLDEGSVRKPFVQLDAVLRYGLISGALGAAVRAFLDLESALSSLALEGRRASPLLPIAATRRPAVATAKPAPPPPAGAQPPPITLPPVPAPPRAKALPPSAPAVMALPPGTVSSPSLASPAAAPRPAAATSAPRDRLETPLMTVAPRPFHAKPAQAQPATPKPAVAAAQPAKRSAQTPPAKSTPTQTAPAKPPVQPAVARPSPAQPATAQAPATKPAAAKAPASPTPAPTAPAKPEPARAAPPMARIATPISSPAAAKPGLAAPKPGHAAVTPRPAAPATAAPSPSASKPATAAAAAPPKPARPQSDSAAAARALVGQPGARRSGSVPALQPPETSPLRARSGKFQSPLAGLDQAAASQQAAASPPAAPSPAPAAPVPAAPPALRAPSGENRLSFQELNAVDVATGLEALTASGAQRRVETAELDPFVGFERDAIDLAWLGTAELEALDAELARATETSGLHELDTTTAPAPHSALSDDESALAVDVDVGFDLDDELPPASRGAARELLPPASAKSFEDSGLFLIFVDESELETEIVTERSRGDDPDDFSLEIDISPPSAPSAAEQAFRSFVDHVDSILLRLVDSLELALLGNQATELLDVHRQLNRLARVLDFVELDRQLSLLVYIQELLPVDFAPHDEPFQRGLPRLQVVREQLPAFQGRLGELLNCLVYLLGYLLHEIPGLRRDRYQRPLVEIYGQLGVLPADPSGAAPTGLYGHADGLKLTSRTRAMLARALEARLQDILEHVERSLLHGQPHGFVDAAMQCYSTAQLLIDQGVPDAPLMLGQMAEQLESLGPMGRPGHEFVEHLRSAVERLTPLLPTFDGEPFVERTQALIERATFSERHSTDRHRQAEADAAGVFARHWPRFRQVAAPSLDALLGLAPGREVDSLPPVLETVQQLRALAAEHHIDLLDRLLATLQQHWERAPHTCAHVLEDLAASVRALPSEGARFEQLEALARSVVSDLVKRRSHPSAQRVTDELGTAVLRLVTQIDGASKSLQRHVARRDLERLGELRPELRELADSARRHDCLALALALDVVAALAGERAEAGEAQSTLMAALERANRCLGTALDDLVERLDESDGEAHSAGTDLWFGSWLEHADELVGPATAAPERPLPLVLRRALHEIARESIERVETVWHSLGSSALFNAAQLTEYQSGLEGLRQLTAYWHQPELNRRIAEHHVGLVSMGGRDELERFGARWNELREAIVAALPEIVALRLDAAGQRFAAAILGWAASLQARLDAGESRALNNWTAEARTVLEQLAPLARQSRCVPFVGLACELRNVLVASAEYRGEQPPPALEHLLYWTQRLILALAPAQASVADAVADATAARAAATPVSVRVPLAPTLELSRQARVLNEQIATLQALIGAGPLTFTGQAGRETLEGFRGALGALDAVLGELSPPSLSTRVEQLARRCEHRGRLLGRTVRVETWIDRGDDLSRASHRHQELLVTVLGALETLAEGVVDAGFEAGIEQTGGPTLRLELHVAPSSIRATLDHNAAALDLKRALAALDAAGVSPPPPSGVVGALGSAPHALRRLRGGSVLVLADAMLTRSGASLLLEEVGGWHRLAIEWRDVAAA